MKERLRQLRSRIDGMTVRERALLLLVLAAVLYMLWQTALLDPLLAERKRLQQERTTLHQEIAELQQQAAETIRRHERDPNAPLRERLEALTGRVDEVERAIAREVSDLIAPAQMSRVLEDLLTRNSGLRLRAIENRPPRPLIPPRAEEPADDGEGAAAGVYRHGLQLRFEGSYRQTVAYLKELEALEWGLYWDGLHLELQEYPQVRIGMQVHTLSLEEGWLGVGGE